MPRSRSLAPAFVHRRRARNSDAHRPRRLPQLMAAVVAACFLEASPSQALDGTAVSDCHRQVLRGIAAVSRGRIAILGRCLKEGRYDSCPDNDNHGIAHENELRAYLTSDASSCRAALDSGAAVADFGPASCGDEWNGCDVVVPSIASLEDLSECLICQQHGFDAAVRDTLGLPRAQPSDIDERRCTRRLARLVTNTIRKVVHDTAACAAEGGAKPFDCPADATGSSRFGRALATFAKNVSFCRIDEGQAPGVLANLCHGDAGDAAALTDCLSGLAKCLACHTANAALGQSADCVAFSGYADCDGTL